MRRRSLASVIVLPLLAAIGLGILIWYGISTSNSNVGAESHTYSFKRDLGADQGRALRLDEIVSVEDPSVTLASLFSTEAREVYGANARGIDGLELNVLLKETRASSEETVFATFHLEKWDKAADNGLYPIRMARANAFLDEELAPVAARFAARRNLELSFNLLFDVTNGISDQLIEAAKNVVVEQDIQPLLEVGQTLVINAGMLTEIAYPGSRKSLTLQSPADLDQVWSWLRSASKRPNSSVYAGLSAQLSLMGGPGKVKVIDIFTDGLENSDQLSLYGDMGMRLLQSDDSRLDEYFDSVFTADVTGMTILLHPLPPDLVPAKDRERQGLALKLLKRKLEEHGAKKVEIEVM